MVYKIKIIYDTEDMQYVVFVEGLAGIDGYGETEEEAIEDFNRNFKLRMS